MTELMGQIAMVAMLPLFVFLVLLRLILAERRSMFARAKAILDTMDDPEERVELLLFRSGWCSGVTRGALRPTDQTSGPSDTLGSCGSGFSDRRSCAVGGRYARPARLRAVGDPSRPAHLFHRSR